MKPARLLLVFVAIGVLPISRVLAAAGFYVVDTADAYQRSTALRDLLPQVNERLAKLQKEFTAQSVGLKRDISNTEMTPMPLELVRSRKASALLKLRELEAKTAIQEHAIGAANERAIAQVDAVVAQIRTELAKEYGATAVLPAQDVLYFKRGAAFDLTDELYKRLNQRLPHVALAP
jgi:Skp family chaperone for outer membrane proteins